MVLLNITSDMVYVAGQANNADFKYEQNKNIFKLVHH